MIRYIQSSCRRFVRFINQLLEKMGGVFVIFSGAIVLPSLLIVSIGLALDLDAIVAIASWPFKIVMYVIAFNCFVIFPFYMVAVFISKANLGAGDSSSSHRGADFGDDGGE